MQGVCHVTANSSALRGRGDITLFSPRHVDVATPVVILLHGVYGSHWNWVFLGSADRIARTLMASGQIPEMVIAMPSDGLWGSGSGYVRRDGRNHGAWVAEEVPDVVAKITGARGPRFIAGLSMGGHGALSLAARYPGQFAGAVGHSSVTSLSELEPFVRETWEGHDLADEILVADHMPPFRFDCGTEDPLIGPNRRLHRRLSDVSHEWSEHPGGHDWSYWTARLPATLRFFGSLTLSLG